MALSTSERRACRAELRRVSQAYLQQARALSYRELCAHQDAPWASIAFGAAGIATAAWRSGDVATARRWLAAARSARADGALWSPTFARRDVEPSIYFGADGLALVGVLAGAGATARRAFVARCRRRRGGSTELLHGVAGTLTALVLVHRATGDAHALEVADELAHDLLARAGGRRGWARSPKLGFAHGRAGTLHALFGWSIAAARALPASVFDDLARLERDLSRGVTSASSWSAFERSWCNGAAGLVLLWARAYEHTWDPRHLRAARDAAGLLVTDVDGAPGDLCCGLGGRAYALLAMDRVEPGHGWHDHALAMGAHATRAMLAGCGAWPNGLHKGYPGLVCLAHDLLAPPADHCGFPLVELGPRRAA